MAGGLIVLEKALGEYAGISKSFAGLAQHRDSVDRGVEGLEVVHVSSTSLS